MTSSLPRVQTELTKQHIYIVTLQNGKDETACYSNKAFVRHLCSGLYKSGNNHKAITTQLNISLIISVDVNYLIGKVPNNYHFT